MSTILDALKKVEQEHDTSTDAGQQRQLDALQPASGRQPQISGKKVVTWGAMALVLLMLVGLTLYLFQKEPETQGQPTPEQAKAQPRPAITREPQPPKAAPPAKRTPIDLPRIKKSWPDPQTPTKPLTDRSALDAANRPAPTPRPTRRPERASRANIQNRATLEMPTPGQSPQPVPAPRRQPRPKVAQPQPALQPRQQPKPPTPALSPAPALAPVPARRTAPPPPAPAATAKRAPKPYGNVARLTDNSLKIQAIAWSQTPDERMAVINSQIVREGSAVDDYDVVAIQPDEVIVRKGGQMFKAIFGRP